MFGLKNNFLVRTRVIGMHWSYVTRSGLGSNQSTCLQRLDRILNKNGFVQFEKYLNIVSFLEMPLKIKFALKSAGKLLLLLPTVWTQIRLDLECGLILIQMF